MKPHLASVYFLVKWEAELTLCTYPDKDLLSNRAGGLLAFFPLESLAADLLRHNSYVVQLNHLKRVLVTEGV